MILQWIILHSASRSEEIEVSELLNEMMDDQEVQEVAETDVIDLVEAPADGNTSGKQVRIPEGCAHEFFNSIIFKKMNFEPEFCDSFSLLQPEKISKLKQMSIRRMFGGRGEGEDDEAASDSDADEGPGDKRKRKRDHRKEEKHRKGAATSWFHKFPWLRMGSSKRDLFCNLCSVVLNKRTAIGPRKSICVAHAVSDKHKNSIVKYSGGEFDPEAAVGTQGELERAATAYRPNQKLLVMYDEAASQIMKAGFARKEMQFRAVFTTLKLASPMSDYPEWMDTIGAHSSIGTIAPRQHGKYDAGWEIADSMSAVLLNRLRELVRKCEFFSVSVDASTAKNHQDYFDVEARFWCGGKLYLEFVSMIALKQKTSAAGQRDVLLEALTGVDGLNLSTQELAEKLVAIAADGCNTMQGHRGGLLTLMEDKAPHILKISCIAHKINLAVEALDKCGSFKRITHAVRGVATYFHNSTKRHDRLQELQEELCLPQLKPVAVNETRWMPVYHAMTVLMKILPAVLRVVREEKDTNPNAFMLHNELSKGAVLFGMHAVEPMLKQLQILTKVRILAEMDYEKKVQFLNSFFLISGDANSEVIPWRRGHCVEELQGSYQYCL